MRGGLRHVVPTVALGLAAGLALPAAQVLDQLLRAFDVELVAARAQFGEQVGEVPALVLRQPDLLVDAGVQVFGGTVRRLAPARGDDGERRTRVRRMRYPPDQLVAL